MDPRAPRSVAGSNKAVADDRQLMIPTERQMRSHYTLSLRGEDWILGRRTLIMGVVNVTPDSFSDGGRFFDLPSALDQARRMVDAGVDILDIGGESTRPFSDPVGEAEELQRVLPVIEAIRRESDVLVSIDTQKAAVATRALDAGADIINDVSALRFDPQMATVAAESGVPVIVMHMLGTPRTMQKAPHYDSLFSEIIAFLEQRIRFATANGIDRNQIIVDPGIGFGKTIEHNLLIIRDLERFTCLDRPILLGASRKRFIGDILGRDIDDRERGTAAVKALAVAHGAHIVRVHDVAFQADVIRMTDAIMAGRRPASGS